jgi:uncharacterized protein YecE (DUF72 family)
MISEPDLGLTYSIKVYMIVTHRKAFQNIHVYSLNFADDQVLIAQDHDDMEFMA